MHLFIYVAALLVALILAAALRLVSLEPRGRLGREVAIAVAAPLIALTLYLVAGYERDAWWPFPYNSTAPHAITAACTLGLLLIALSRATGRLAQKLLVGAVAIASWTTLWFCGVFAVACDLGYECI